MRATELLRAIVLARAGDEANWVKAELERLEGGAPERDLHIFMGLVPRRLGKADLRPTAEESAAAERVCPGWSLDAWSIDGAARVLAILSHAGMRPFAERFKGCCQGNQ
jgi:hypothetical protein